MLITKKKFFEKKKSFLHVSRSDRKGVPLKPLPVCPLLWTWWESSPRWCTRWATLSPAGPPAQSTSRAPGTPGKRPREGIWKCNQYTIMILPSTHYVLYEWQCVCTSLCVYMFMGCRLVHTINEVKSLNLESSS